MTICPHEKFAAHVSVSRLTGSDGGPVTGYLADVRVICADCHEQFRFMGLPAGVSLTNPTVSPDGEEARLPIGPASTTMSLIDHLQKGNVGGNA